MKRVRVACVGAGYWGKNLVRVFDELAAAHLVGVCDADEGALARIRQRHPGVRTSGDYHRLLEDPDLEAVVLAVPAIRHYDMARAALEAGKHAYVEKPLTLEAAQALHLCQLAEERGLVLMVGHLLLYHPAVELLGQLVRSGELGEIYYLYAQRVNLGIVRRDENALWSLAPHDIAVVLYLLGEEPAAVSARGASYLQEGIEDVVFANLHFADGKMAQLQLSWLDPHKVRRLTVVGSRKMAVFDDVESSEKIRLYDKAAEAASYASYGDSITLRFGDITIPHIAMHEPLGLECQHFLDCIRRGERPRSDGRDGLRVVRVLEAAQRSLRNSGIPEPLT